MRTLTLSHCINSLGLKVSFEHTEKNIISRLDLFELYDFLGTVKAEPHECVIRTGQPKTKVKPEKEAWFYSKVTVTSCTITSI